MNSNNKDINEINKNNDLNKEINNIKLNYSLFRCSMYNLKSLIKDNQDIDSQIKFLPIYKQLAFKNDNITTVDRKDNSSLKIINEANFFYNCKFSKIKILNIMCKIKQCLMKENNIINNFNTDLMGYIINDNDSRNDLFDYFIKKLIKLLLTINYLNVCNV